MRMTVTTKLAAGFTLLSCLGLSAMVVVYWGLDTVGKALRELAEQREPASAAGHEMEINLNEVVSGVRQYVASGDPDVRRQIENDAADFQRFLERYRKLARSPTEVGYAEALGSAFAEFEGILRLLLEEKDLEMQKSAAVSRQIARLDDLLDAAQARVSLAAPAEEMRRVLATLDLETELAEVGMWLASFQRTHHAEERAHIDAGETECLRSIERIAGLAHTDADRAWLASLREVFDPTMTLVREIVRLEDSMFVRSTLLDLSRETMDELLDERVQATANQALRAPRQDADRASGRVRSVLVVLIPVFLVSALAIGLGLLRGITVPLRRLVEGTAAISAGNLSYRVQDVGDDEFGDLAEHFNRMVARLEATTVSKERLEASEAQLRATVAELREEVSERLRAEAEGERLRDSLHRSQTISAMGALVARVAHEVRNPLFGISSTLDALDARLAAQEETRRHVTVLRGEVERLSRLMRDLLNYGRPLEVARREIDAIGAVVDEAIRSCAMVARDSGIAIEHRRADGDDAVVMDRSAMLQVFQNLLENAIQHAPAGSTVTIEDEVRWNDGPGVVVCAVADAGPGFRDEDLEHVFEPFFTRRRGGTGLGLSIVQRIVDQHGGSVAASNGTRGGGVVTVRLPLADRVAAPLRAATSA